MQKEEEKSVSGCPYFNQKMKSCGLSADGIYLPPQVHVLTHCLTLKYKDCSIYTRFIPMESEGHPLSEEAEANRRRFKRIPEQRRVLIRTCSPEGLAVGDFAEMASTMDYSPKGMRIIINKNIPPESLLLFDFDTDFLIPRLQGFARLCWHRKCQDDPHGIEAGLVFKDEFSQKAIMLAMSDPEN